MKKTGTRLTVLLHDREGLDDDLGRRSDEDLSLSSSFGVDDRVLPRVSACPACPLRVFRSSIPPAIPSDRDLSRIEARRSLI